MTEKRLFVGRKTCEDRFTIITDCDGEIGVKENRSGDVLVLKHSDLNAQQFVAQLVVFLNDQNQAIVDLYDGSKYWSDKATEKIKELEKENEQLKEENKELKSKFKFEEVDADYVLSLLKRTIGELKYFIKDYEEDEIDITVHSLIRDVDLLLGDKQDIFSGYISFIIDCNEDLEKENKELKKENQMLKSKHMEMLDFVEDKGTVTVNDIKQWWNTTR